LKVPVQNKICAEELWLEKEKARKGVNKRNNGRK